MKPLLILLVFITSLFAEKNLPIPEIEQRKDQWCWSGSSTAILTYYGEKVSQGQIAQFAYGDSSINQWNWLFGSSAVDYNGKTYYPKGIDYIMQNWNTPVGGGGYPLTEAQYKSEINAGHPFVIRYGWNSGGGHFVVGMGYLDNGNYQLMNPWFGTGYTVNSYNWILTAEGGRGNWTHTLTTNRAVGVTTYALTVSGGTGSGSFAAAAQAPIVATVPAGKTFVKWSGAGTAINDSLAPSTSITMPAKALAVTAVFQTAVATKYALTITGGTGSGSFESGVSTPIVATVPAGKTFVKWSGAGSAINDSLSQSATITMPAKALAVSAVFQTEAVIDTSKLSENFVKIGAWESLVDEIGSTASIDSSKKVSGELAVQLTLVKDADPSYAWGKATASVAGNYSLCDAVVLTYRSSDSIRLVLDNPALGLDGIDFGYSLPGVAQLTTVVLPLTAFAQPDWIEPAQKVTFDPSAVQSVSIEAVRKNQKTEYTVTALKLNKFVKDAVVLGKNSGLKENPMALVIHNQLELRGVTGPIAVSILSLSGRELFTYTGNIGGASFSLALPALGKGVHLLMIKTDKMVRTIKLNP